MPGVLRSHGGRVPGVLRSQGSRVPGVLRSHRIRVPGAHCRGHTRQRPFEHKNSFFQICTDFFFFMSIVSAIKWLLIGFDEYFNKCGTSKSITDMVCKNVNLEECLCTNGR